MSKWTPGLFPGHHHENNFRSQTVSSSGSALTASAMPTDHSLIKDLPTRAATLLTRGSELQCYFEACHHSTVGLCTA